MKHLGLYTILLACLFAAACDVQSGITKKAVEKYEPTPTPEKRFEVVEPIDPADVINAPSGEQGPTLVVNRETYKRPVNCTKHNRVMVNGNDYEVNIKGVCKQLMVNGHGNQIVVLAASEIILNGRENSVEYSKYANGQRPVITDNTKQNSVTKAATPLKTPTK